ncbi:MAG: O-antigen ligase [Ignavibacteriales bacterium]|nr:O-antigen ligase [Ignavibacteriales bacterium]
MSWISWICFGICLGIIFLAIRRHADPFSPARIFGFVWSFSIALTELKFSAFQHSWTLESWILLLTAIIAFLIGTFIAYVLNLQKELIPLNTMRNLLSEEKINESRLFWLICLSVAVYSFSYIVSLSVKGWLPIFVVGSKISRVDFNISGLTLFLFSASFIIFFTIIYILMVKGNKAKKNILVVLSLITVGSYVLLLQRYQIIMAGVICFVLLYYASHYIRPKTVIILFTVVTAFFYWIMSLRLGNLLMIYMYRVSKMNFSKDYAFLTEPYMYVVMNLENFARSVNLLEYHTYGYFTFDFITAISGLKYWIIDYFNLSRMPYLTSSYNTYTAFWWFYSDFGVIGLASIPFILGFSSGLIYYRMRSKPSIKNVTAYGLMIFVMFITYFNFPISFLWFEYNLLVIYLFLRWTIIPQKVDPRVSIASL